MTLKNPFSDFRTFSRVKMIYMVKYTCQESPTLTGSPVIVFTHSY